MRAAEVPSTERMPLPRRDWFAVSYTEFAERLKMVTSVHDISDGLLAGDNLLQETYMLSDSAIVRSI